MQPEVWHLHRFISQWTSVDAPLDTLKTRLILSQVYSNNDPPPCSAADNITWASFLSGYKHQKVAQILLENDLGVESNTIDHSEVWIYYSGFLSSDFNNANTGAGLQYSEGNTHQWFDPSSICCWSIVFVCAYKMGLSFCSVKQTSKHIHTAIFTTD